MQIILLLFVAPLLVFAQDGGPTVAELRKIGDEAMLNSKSAEAIEAYSKWIALEPDNVVARYKRASVHLRRRNYNSALPDLSKALKLDPTYLKALLHRSKVYYRLGQCHKAQEDLEAALRLDPQNKKVPKEMPKVKECIQLVDNAERLYNSGDCRAAKPALDKALNVAQLSENLLIMRADCFLKHKDYHDALMDTRAILKINKNNLEALYIRGRAYYYLIDHDVALDHYRQGLRSDPEHKKLKKAFKDLKKLVKQVKKGDKSFASKQSQDAVDAYLAAIEMDPTHTSYHYDLLVKVCDAYIQKKDGELAVTSCTKVLNLNQESVEAWMKRGEANMVKEEWQQAINDYQKATQMDNTNRAAKEGLQKAQLELKKSKRKDYYKILGVQKNVDSKKLKKVFRKLALQYHPDKVAEADKEASEKKFQEIVEAYEVLSDDELRGKYDRGEEVHPNQGGGGGGGGGGFNPFAHFHHGGGGQRFHFKFG